MTRTLLALALALTLAGCPRSSDRGDSGGDIPIDSLATEQAAAICDFLFRCDIGDDDTIGLKLILRDPGTCADYMIRVFNQGSLDALERAVAGGTLVYDSEAAGRCVDSLRSGCSAAVGGSDLGSDDCNSVFTGTVAEGGACWLREECAPGLECDFGAGTCPGTCVAGASEGFCGGATCSDGQECFYPEVGTERCVTEVVEADAAEGMGCGLIAETETQVTRRGCMPGLWCTGDFSTAGTCRTPIAADAPCSTDDDVCVSGHLCAGGTCREVIIARTAGAPCDESTLQVCDPLLRLECVGGACTEIGDGNDGSPCRGGDYDELTCNAGLVCHDDTMTCGAPKPAGATCGSNVECASGSCDYSTGTCRDQYCDY